MSYSFTYDDKNIDDSRKAGRNVELIPVYWPLICMNFQSLATTLINSENDSENSCQIAKSRRKDNRLGQCHTHGLSRPIVVH